MGIDCHFIGELFLKERCGAGIHKYHIAKFLPKAMTRKQLNDVLSKLGQSESICFGLRGSVMR